MTFPIGPAGLTMRTAGKTESPTDLRSGTVAAVTPYGLEVTIASGTVKNASHLSSYNPAVGDPVTLLRFENAWVVLGRPVGPGTASDAATPGLGAGTTLLAGMALSGTGATMASSTGSAVVVPRYGVTFFHPANHWVLLLCGFTRYSSVANDWMSINIRNASFLSAVVGGGEFVQAGNNFYAHFETIGVMIPPTPYGGSGSSYFVEVKRENGSGTSRIDDPSNRRGFMLALDMGDGSMVETK